MKSDIIVFEVQSKKQETSLHIAILIQSFIETIKTNRHFPYFLKHIKYHNDVYKIVYISGSATNVSLILIQITTKMTKEGDTYKIVNTVTTISILFSSVTIVNFHCALDECSTFNLTSSL